MRSVLRFVLALVPILVFGQSGEITPFASWHGGGEFETSLGRDPDLEGRDAWGLAVTLDRGRGRKLDVIFSRQEAALVVEDLFRPPDDILVGVDIEYLHVGGRYVFDPGARARPYIGGTIGLTRFSADEGGSDVRFSSAFGAGVDLGLTRRLALRLDGRWYVTFVDANAELTCAGGDCIGFGDASGFGQLALSAGVVVAFGQ